MDGGIDCERCFNLPDWVHSSGHYSHIFLSAWQTALCVAVNVLSVLLLLYWWQHTQTVPRPSVYRSTTALTSPECPAVSSVERRYALSMVLSVSYPNNNLSNNFRATWSPAQITYKYEACLARSQFLEMSTNTVATPEKNSSPARSLVVALKPSRRILDLPLLQHDELPPCEELNRCRDHDELVTGH